MFAEDSTESYHLQYDTQQNKSVGDIILWQNIDFLHFQLHIRKENI